MAHGAPGFDGPERKRLNDQQSRSGGWRKWGPYLSERQWGTVRSLQRNRLRVGLLYSWPSSLTRGFRLGPASRIQVKRHGAADAHSTAGQAKPASAILPCSTHTVAIRDESVTQPPSVSTAPLARLSRSLRDSDSLQMLFTR